MLHGIHHPAYQSPIRPRILARYARHNPTIPGTDVAENRPTLETDPTKEEWCNSR